MIDLFPGFGRIADTSGRLAIPRAVAVSASANVIDQRSPMSISGNAAATGSPDLYTEQRAYEPCWLGLLKTGVSTSTGPFRTHVARK